MTYTSKLNETRYILSDSWEGKSWNKFNASFTLWKIGRIFKYIFPSYSPTFPLHYPQNSISNLLLANQKNTHNIFPLPSPTPSIPLQHTSLTPPWPPHLHPSNKNISSQRISKFSLYIFQSFNIPIFVIIIINVLMTNNIFVLSFCLPKFIKV